MRDYPDDDLRKGPWRLQAARGRDGSRRRSVGVRAVEPVYVAPNWVTITGSTASWVVEYSYTEAAAGAIGRPLASLPWSGRRQFWTRRGALRFAHQLQTQGVLVQPGYTELRPDP